MTQNEKELRDEINRDYNISDWLFQKRIHFGWIYHNPQRIYGKELTYEKWKLLMKGLCKTEQEFLKRWYDIKDFISNTIYHKIDYRDCLNYLDGLRFHYFHSERGKKIMEDLFVWKDLGDGIRFREYKVTSYGTLEKIKY